MKKNLILFLFLFVTFYSYSQTWVVDGREAGQEDFDFEYTIITKAQFDRILKANEQTSTYVILNYTDNIEMLETKVKSGSRPKLNGYYYISAKMFPKTDLGKIAVSFFKTTLMYGNSETGVMTISFLNRYITDSISLDYERDEYNKKFNQLLSIINTMIY